MSTLIRLATDVSERQDRDTFESDEEFEYKEAVRDMRADQLRAAIYGLAQKSGMAQGYIDAKDYVRKMKPALRDRAKALYEGTAKIEDYHEIPPKPAELLFKERKSEEYKRTRAENKAQRDLEEQTIHSQLDEEEKQTVAEHYGSDSYDKVKDKFVADVIKAMNEGLDAVAEALRGIIRKLQAGMLAAVITLNSAYMTPPIPVAIPTETRTVQVRAEVPAEAAAYMSEGAKTAYSVIYPAMKQYFMDNNKAFVITDKPTAESFIFLPNGKLLLHTKTLLGSAFGDYYKGHVDEVKANRITPAGGYFIDLRDAKRGVTEYGGNEAKTAGAYDYGKVFVLDKAIDGKASVTLMHSAWLRDSDAEARRAALKTKGPQDARMSHACINYDTKVFGYLLDNHEEQLKRALLFIVPEDPKNTMDFINGEAVDTGDLRRVRIEPLTETVVEKMPQAPLKQEERNEQGILREEQKPRAGRAMAARRRRGTEDLGLTEADIYRIEQQLDMDPDPNFYGFTTLTGALIYITESPNRLEAELAARLLQDDNIDMVGETSFEVVETDSEGVDPEAKAMLDDDAAGVYMPYTDGGSVLVSGTSYGEGQGINNEIVLHEAMHAVGAKKIAYVELAEKQDAPVPARLAEAVHQLRDLMDRTRETYVRMKAAGTSAPNLDRLAEAKAFTDIQEFYAYGLTDPDMKLFLRDEVPGVSTKTTGFDRFVEIMMKLFGVDPALKSGLKDMMLISHEIMQAKKPSAKKLAALARSDLGGPLAAKRNDARNTATEARAEATADADAARINSTPIFEDQLEAIGPMQKAARTAEGFINFFVENYYDMTGTAREFWLGQVPTDALFRTMKRAEIGQGETIKALTRESNTFKLGQMKLVESLGKEWLALKSKEGIRLAEVMHKSTIARVDPSKDKSDAKLNRMWEALTPEAQTVYKKVRDYYATQAKLAHAVMIQNVQNSQMNPESKEKVIETLEKLYGDAARISPYFPLMRFGNFWLQTGRGENLRFEMFETEGKRNTARAKYLKEMKRKGDNRSEADLRSNKELSDGDNINTLRERMSDNSDMLKDVLRKISELGNTSDATKEALARDVFQMHLMTLPETKFQKAFIHRKDVEGYSKDGLRSFVTMGRRMATQLANIKYQPKLRLAFSAAVDSIEGKPTRAKDEALIKALENRVRGSLAPPEQRSRLYDSFDALVHFATKFTFMYHLTDMRAVMNNMWSLPSRSAPVLTKHFGPGAVLKQMGTFTRHAYAQVGVTKVDKNGNVTYTMPSFGSSALVRNDPLLQYAVEEMDKRGIATQGTQTYDLYLRGLATAESKAGLVFDAGVRISGALHQGSERITREVTFLTAFKMAMTTPRLGTNKRMTKEEAVAFAHDVTDEALYNFLPENLPGWTRNPAARLAIQFHKWAIYTSFYYGANLREMLKPLPGNTRRGAAYAVLGSMTMGALGSGITGVFGVSFVMGMYQMLANMINGDDDDEEDILKSMDFTRWFNEIFLPERFGNIDIGGFKLSDMMADGILTTATGADFTSGLSEGNLYFRGSPDSFDFDSAISNSTISIPSPALGTLAGMYKAGKAYAEGDTLKAMSKFIPVKTIRAPFEAYRLGKEGAMTPGLESKMDPEEFTRGVLFMQGLGYRPAALAKLEDSDAFINKHSRQIMSERSDIIRRLVKAQELGRDDLVDKVLDEAQRFNSEFRHSELAINAEAIEEHRDAMAERRSTTLRGLQIKPKFYQLYPARERAVEKADTGK